jgi:hypothetical protein
MGKPLAAIAVSVFALGFAACGGGDNGDTAPSPPPTEQVRINGSPVRETAETYCGGPGRLADLARIVGLPSGTRSLNRIAASYGESLAGNSRDHGHPMGAAIREAASEGCLEGLLTRD